MLIIAGPTASGKSALAIDVARRLGTEIISADSRQIYHGLPIITAQPTAEQRMAVPHHLVDILPLDAYYSASMFEEQALAIARDIMQRCGTVVVCGGSMLYVDALCHGIDELPTVPDDIRQGLMQEHAERGDEWLRAELLRLDTEYYNQVDLANTKRVFHAVEIIRASGKSYTSLRQGIRKEREFKIHKFMLDWPRAELFDRINRRVDAMVASGAEQEVRNVLPLRGLNSLNTVGVKELFEYFDGTMDRTTAIERIKKNTRVYAKKQMTWWNKDLTMQHLDCTMPGLTEQILAHIL